MHVPTLAPLIIALSYSLEHFKYLTHVTKQGNGKWAASKTNIAVINSFNSYECLHRQV